MTRSSRFADGEALHQLFKEIFTMQNALTEIMDSIHDAAGLSTPQVRLATLLHNSGPDTVPHLATAFNVSRQFIQTVCNDLDAAGLVEFCDNPHHKRSKLVALTDRGREVYAATKEKEAAIVKNNLPDIDADQVAQASALLADIRQRIEGAADTGILLK